MTRLFEPVPLPRGRAVLAVVFAALALLAAGGTLEYGTGSPMIRDSAAATYWSFFFAFNLVAFGGAALLGGLPGLAQPAIKAAWVALLLLLHGIAFGIWYRALPTDPLAALTLWASKSVNYLPAVIAVLSGLLWRPLGTKHR